MEMVQAAEVRKLHEINRKMKELLPACDELECQTACDNDGYGRGSCFSDDCVCYEMKKVEAEEAEKRLQVNKEYRELCTADPPCIEACKKDGFCSGQCLEYICYCLPNCTDHHSLYPPKLN